MWEPGQTLNEALVEAVEDTLVFYEGNKMRSSRALGISIRTLYNYIEREERLVRFRPGRMTETSLEASRRLDLLFPDE